MAIQTHNELRSKVTSPINKEIDL